MKTQFNVIDLFCGAGGLSYGFEMAGFNILLGIDNDQMALKTFEKNHKGSKTICGDIRQINQDQIQKVIGKKKIDVIIGGPPCQGFSLSGPRNFNDPRNSLYLSYIRLVDQIRPNVFVIENVPGLARLFGGVVKNNIINEFTKMGYKVQFQILHSEDYGVPQKRRRVVFVGTKNGFSFNYPQKQKGLVTCKMALSDLPPLPDNSFLGSDFQPYLSTPTNNYQKLMRVDSSGIYNHVAAHHDERVKKIIALVPPGGNYKDLPEELRNASHFHVAWTRFPDNEPAPTIDTGHRHHFHYQFDRVPTVRECARIQSFPDRFVFLGNKTQQFRQVGNAVPPLMAQAIANEVKKSLSQGGPSV
jgi:DNA (cytosine-5)-methyltransferase 1